MKLLIQPELKQLAPDLVLGVVCAKVRVAEHDERLWSLISHCAGEILRTESLPALADIPEIKALRQVFRATGKEPSRYRGSQESLFRRILQGKGLDSINTVVDINNLISLESRHSAGCYDLACVRGPVTFRVGQPGESYQGIGKDPINVTGLPVFADQDGPFGSPTRDSARAKVTLSATNIMMVIIAFSGPARLDEFLQRAVELLVTYASADRESCETFMLT